MNRSVLSLSLVAAMLTTSVSFTALADKEDNGAILGAIVGGILGNQVGKGNGKTVATGLGIILGAVVGADIGRDLDNSDRRALEEAQRDAFLRPIGERSDWDGNRYGSRTGARGNFRTTREGYLRTNSREICREYESTIVTRQKTETKTGIACSSANGSWREVNSTEVVFRDGSSIRNETVVTGNNGRPGNYRPSPVRPIEPVRPTPRPPVVVPAPNYGSSLQGYCQDYDHQQFYAAKNFAYSSNGLNYTDAQATQWALQYNQSHRCGTIQEFSSRFSAIQSMAYSTDGLNMTSAQARDYALNRVEYVNAYQVQEMRRDLVAVKNFVYSTNGLNRDSATSSRVAREWIERGNCESADQVQRIWTQYTQEYNFAYSTNGLNMSSNGARDYATNRISRMSRCSDLLR